MFATQKTSSATSNDYAFRQGIPMPVVLRLLDGSHTPADRRLYYRCQHWQTMKARALEAH